MLAAFTELSSDRAVTMGGIGPIPWTSIRAYCHDEGLTFDEADEFRQLIRALDAAFLAYTVKRRDKPDGR